MRTTTGAGVLLAIILVVAGTAGADVIIGGQTIPNGPLVMKYVNYDVGALYTVGNGLYVGDANLNALPQTAPTGGRAGEDSWAIFRVESISNANQTVTYYNRYTAAAEITGIVWGEKDTYLNQTGAGSSLTQDIHGVGMHVAFFVDSSKNFDPTLGPSARAADGSYPTVTDGQLIWTFNSVAGWDVSFPGDEFFTTFRPNAGVGDTSANGGMFAGLGSVPLFGTGAWNGDLDPNGVASGVAARLDFTGAVGSDGWMVNSNDPVRLTLVPEPGTMAVLVLGGLALIRRRRRA